ncbi:16S rRNA (guanine(966)-N(2))-methyltransferase RsmD [Bacillus chungangensis]|uniref:16S rRNA (guanine(966)-N(2))-methyltransferase RsmD n=1 Tax=Bacillus chungangensis TaxID=587633 RepID=UPI0027D82893|nr:16S rRNA (guanine(966)-N(2))-methyltransferase RsmD [Bacillus chungangensis]
MRVISGICKGRPLKAVPGSQTRPTTDKVKETIFNMIGPYFSGGIGLDLFAGSGGLGIEALSRGIDRMIFVDKNRKAVQTVKQNIQLCQFQDRSEVFCNEAIRALKAIMKRELCFEVIFFDPPYDKQHLETLLQMVDEAQLLSATGFLVCEHKETLILPRVIGTLEQIKNHTFGMTGLTIYTKEKNEGINK